MDFDFDDFSAATEPLWFDVTDPRTGVPATRNGKAVRVAILGPDAPEMIEWEGQRQNKNLDRVGATGKITAAVKAEVIEADSTSRACKVLRNWENFAREGVDLPYSAEAAKDMITSKRWFRDFIEKLYLDRGNFLGIAVATPKK